MAETNAPLFEREEERAFQPLLATMEFMSKTAEKHSYEMPLVKNFFMINTSQNPNKIILIMHYIIIINHYTKQFTGSSF